MPRIVPSQIVEFIETSFPNIKEKPSDNFSLGKNHSAVVTAVADLIDQIPSELILLEGRDYVGLVAAVSAMRTTVEFWKVRDYGLGNTPGFKERNPLLVVHSILSDCPDEFPSKKSKKLPFIEDEQFRRNLEIDLSATDRALLNGEWKAATILAGSVIEALLLWSLKRKRQSEVIAVVEALVDEKVLNGKPNKDIVHWTLSPFIEVAHKMKIISLQTTQQARLAQGYRNLIHAGREFRLKKRCDRGTALSAVAAIEHIVGDLYTDSGFDQNKDNSST